MLSKNIEFSREDHTISFIDTCPCELIHKMTDKIVVYSHTNYHNVEIDLIKLRQYKDTRTLDRKLRAQDYIIDCFETKKVSGYGVIKFNSQEVAIHNAINFISQTGIASLKGLSLEDKITIAGETITIGKLVSLTWYAIMIPLCAREAAIWATFENKKKVFMLMDLLPGDSIDSSKHFNVVKHIIKTDTDLEGIIEDHRQDKGLNYIAYGYGIKDGTTKALKNIAMNTINDWISQSFFCKLKCENSLPNEEDYTKDIQFAKLAEYLISKDWFKIDTPFSFQL